MSIDSSGSICRIASIPYIEDVADLFAVLAEQHWAMWLDSGYPASVSGRFDILVADPRKTLVFQDKELLLTTREGHIERIHGDPVSQIRKHLPRTGTLPEAIPFAGGAVGYMSYDLGRVFEALPDQPTADIPLMAIGIYDWAVVVDHQLRRAMLVSNAPRPVDEQQWEGLRHQLSQRTPRFEQDDDVEMGPVQYQVSPESYRQRFDRIQDYIREGDCYQVNIAHCLKAKFKGSPWALYRKLRRVSPAPYAGYLNLPGMQILSASPEQFLAVDQGRVTTRPIKGTRPRAETVEADEQLREQLRNSTKDRAENLMIVDLLRNDLGKVCQPGSIEVPTLFELQSFAQVHHLVSTVTGMLRDDQDALGLLRACLPGGSITGAPKRRAMEIIDELEQQSRGVYCGSVFRVGFDGNMDSSIAIRTITVKEGEALYWAGGGIVSDSRADAEYRESLDKAAPFLALHNSG
ncbi:MAG: aminodeoxychorismate synthase component I [bacterium]